MKIIHIFFILSLTIFLSSCGSETPTHQQSKKKTTATASIPIQPPKTTHVLNKIIINDEMIGTYRQLASRMGFDYDKEYGYRDFYDIKVKNNIGDGGEYEPLMLSTGGDFWDADDSIHFDKQQVAWETFYYKTHNITWIRQIRHQADRSYVKLLKLAEGRVPNLNLQ